MALGRNITFPIYNDDGTSFHGLELRRSSVESLVMSLSDKITGDAYYDGGVELEFTMKEYVMYNDVKYTLVSPPTIVREGMTADNSELKGTTKYSFEFYHPMYWLANYPFSDVAVTSSESRYKSHDKSFSWIGTIVDYVAKLNKNLEGTEWVVSISSRVPQADLAKLSEVLTFNNNSIADALKTAYDTYALPYVIDSIKAGETYYSQGKRFLISFGLPPNEIYDSGNIPYVFQFGKGVGLKNNSRTPRKNKIITRIAGYGSENNIPYGYPQIVWTGSQDATETADGYPLYDGIVGGLVVKLIKHPFTRTHLMPSVYVDRVRRKVNSAASDYNRNIELIDYYDADSSYPNPINPVAPNYEIHEFSDIKPELGQESIVSAVPLNQDLTPASDWDDTMDDDGNYLQSYFQITLPILSFDIYACAAITEAMQINMRSGGCIGCTFDVQVDWDDYKKNFFDSQGNFLPNGEQRNLTKYPKSNEEQISIIVQKDLNTFGTLMPNRYQYPQSGDDFVVLGISLPTSYITNAQERLDDAMQSFMLANNVHYFDYQLKFDEYFLATRTDLLSQIRNNSILRFAFGSEELELFVKQIVIKYGQGVLPQYDITLTDDIEVVLNQIGQVQEDVDNLTSVISALRQSFSNNVWVELSKKLSKVSDDTARGFITFLQGLQVGQRFTSGMLGEGGVFMMKNFLNAAGVNEKKSYAELDNLTVRGTMRVFEFIVSQMLGENDNRIFTAMMEVDHYDPETGKVYLDTQNGKLYNPFRIDDVIVVQQYDPANVGSQGGNGYIVKSYELVITNVGVGSLSDRENRLDWVTFKNFRTEMEGVKAEDIITKNDTFVRIDNLSDPTRRGIAQMMTVGENTPYLDIIYGAKTEPDTKLKARLGNMEGVHNHLFGWLSGWGLYSLNAYLTGQFMLANTGFDTQNAFLITDNGLTSVYRQTRYNVPTNGNYLSNPSFLDDCNDWIADAAYQRTFVTGTDDLVMFNRNYYSDVYGFSGLGEHNGKQMLRLKHNNIIQKNNKIKPATQHREYSGSISAPDPTGHMVYDVMYVTLRFFCVESGKVRIGFIDPDSQGYSWIDDGYEPDGTPFEYPIGHWDERITKGPDVCTIEFSGKWDGSGDFVIDTEGEIYVDFVALTTEPLENLDAEYSTRIEQDAYHISLIAERVAGNTTHISDLTITADAITSRVEVLEGDVLTQGSLITQTSNLISMQVGAINPQTGVFEYSANFALAVEDGISSATIEADQVRIDANSQFTVNDVLTVTNNEVNINGKLNGCDGTFTGELIVNDIDPTIDMDRGVVDVRDIHNNQSVSIATTVARTNIFGYIELYDHIGNSQSAKALLMPRIVNLNDYDHSEAASLATDGLSISTPNYTFQVNSNGIRFVKNGVTYTWP